MTVYKSLGDPRLKAKPRSIAIGIFDGIHRGHQKILQAMIKQSKRFKTSSLAVTFDPHPSKVLAPKKTSPTILMSLPHRLRFLEAMGVHEVLVLRFNKKFARVSHENFLRQILLKRLGMKSLSVGHDFCFGYRALGDAFYLREQSARLGFHFSQAGPLRVNGEVISSTCIRERIEAGDLSGAAEMLGRPVSVYGTVIHGRGRGKSVGFPTANLNPHHEALPPAGVYAAYGYLDGQKLKAVIHIGQRPTFHDREKSLEAHFLRFHKKIYGRDVELIFVKRLRPIAMFDSPKHLASAILADISKAKKLLYFK